MTRVGYPMLPSHVGMVMMIYDGFCYLPTDILGGEMKWIFSNYFCWFFENWSESTSSGREEQSVPLAKDMLVYLSKSRFFVFSLDWRAMIEMSSQRSCDNSWFFAHMRFGVKGIKKLPQHEDSLWKKFIRMYGCMNSGCDNRQYHWMRRFLDLFLLVIFKTFCHGIRHHLESEKYVLLFSDEHGQGSISENGCTLKI